MLPAVPPFPALQDYLMGLEGLFVAALLDIFFFLILLCF